MVGHIKLDRKIIEWEWYNDANTFRIFVHFLLLANFKDGRYKGVVVLRGQLLTDVSTIAKNLNLSIQNVRTSITKLKSTGEITTTSTNRNTLITICKYNTYQSLKIESNNQNNTETNNQLTNNQQTTNKQLTDYTKEGKEEEEKKESKYPNSGVENSPLRTPDLISGFHYLPDGRSYIEPTVFFKKEHFNGLPKDNILAITTFFRTTKKIEVLDEDVKSLWEVFKTQELTEQKPYRNEADVYRHFLNWCKKQTFSKSSSSKNIQKAEPQEKQGFNLQNLADRYDA